MKKCRTLEDHVIFLIDDQSVIVHEELDTNVIDFDIEQYTDDELEIWKTRDDGFLFVYCNRIEIGYWIDPNLVEVIE